MIDVTPALGCIHPFVPKLLNAGDEFFFRSGLDFRLKVQLQFMPNVLNRIEVWVFRRGSPPVDAMLVEKGLGTSRGVFGIIVLHKTMVWLSLIDEWNQSVFKNVAIQIGLHSLENTDFRGATPADASPNMNLKWVFRFWLSLRWFIDLSITRAAKLLKRDGAFVGEDDIIECISRV